jgi:ABC-2 type transport system ATP-binding protein
VLAKLPQVASVKEQDNVVRISSNNGPDTVGALMATAARFGVKVRRVGVQGTTLDDVFLHYTGRQLRDAAGSAGTYDVSHLYNR